MLALLPLSPVVSVFRIWETSLHPQRPPAVIAATNDFQLSRLEGFRATRSKRLYDLVRLLETV